MESCLLPPTPPPFLQHRAVRTAAALFDVSHMSAVAVEGPNALAFLELTMANTAARLTDNEAQYRSELLGWKV